MQGAAENLVKAAFDTGSGAVTFTGPDSVSSNTA
jgi:hypothetical protein